MWLPIEVVAQRPEEVVEVGDLVAQVLSRGDRLLERLGLLVGDGAGLLLQRILLAQNVDGVVDHLDLFEQIGGAGLLIGQVVDLRRTARADLERDRRVIQWRAQRSRDRLHLGDAVGVEDGLGDPLQQDHVGGIAQVVVGLDHQQFGIEPGLGEVALGGRVADVGRGAGRQIGAGVVTRLVSRQGEQTDEGHGDRHHQDGAGPAHDGRPDAPPAPGAHRAGRLEQTEMAADAQHRRRQGQRGHQRDEDANRGGNAQALEIREPARRSDRTPRRQSSGPNPR